MNVQKIKICTPQNGENIYAINQNESFLQKNLRYAGTAKTESQNHRGLLYLQRKAIYNGLRLEQMAKHVIFSKVRRRKEKG